MNDIRKMDWMAPETLKRESEHKGKAKQKKRDEKKPLVGQTGLDRGEGCELISCFSAYLTLTFEDMDVDEPMIDDVDLANAVNLSESEDEVEEEKIAGDFFTTPDTDIVRIRAPPPNFSLS